MDLIIPYPSFSIFLTITFIVKVHAMNFLTDSNKNLWGLIIINKTNLRIIYNLCL